MLTVLLKHIIYDAGISVFFDGLIKSFNANLYGKWASNPEAFKNDHKLGSVIYADFEFWMIDRLRSDKTNSVIKINSYPTIVSGYIPLGVDNKLRLYATTDIMSYEDPVILTYDIITERWNYSCGTFRYNLNRDVMTALGYDLWNSN
jgi:hypothetical protein